MNCLNGQALIALSKFIREDMLVMILSPCIILCYILLLYYCINVLYCYCTNVLLFIFVHNAFVKVT